MFTGHRLSQNQVSFGVQWTQEAEKRDSRASFEWPDDRPEDHGADDDEVFRFRAIERTAVNSPLCPLLFGFRRSHMQR